MKRKTKQTREEWWQQMLADSAKARAAMEQYDRDKREGRVPRPTTEITPEDEERLRKIWRGRPMD